MKDLGTEARAMLAIAARADAAPGAIRHRARQRLLGSLAAGGVTTSAIVAKAGFGTSNAAVSGTAAASGVSAAGTSSLSMALVSAVMVGLSTGLVVISPTSDLSEHSQVTAAPAPQVVSAARPIERDSTSKPETPSPAPALASASARLVAVDPPGATPISANSPATASLAPNYAPLRNGRRDLEPLEDPANTSSLGAAARMPDRQQPAPAAVPMASSSRAELPAAALSDVAAPHKPTKASIATEIALLAEVQRVLAAGNAQLALTALERHTEEYPRGALHEEATASRVVVLCALGRFDEGRRWAATFRQRYPSSPLSKRVQSACPTGRNVPSAD